MAHAAADHSDGHEEHTGHGGHHVFSAYILKRTFAILVGLTILTVFLALWERGFADVFGLQFEYPELPLGWLSVPVALAIAGTKVYFVASYFMGLKYEKGTNLLIFIGSFVFLVIFFAFTFLDFAFRDSFEELSAIPADVLEEEAILAEENQVEIDNATLVAQPDPVLFGTPESPAGPADGEPVEAIPGEAGPAVTDAEATDVE